MDQSKRKSIELTCSGTRREGDIVSDKLAELSGHVREGRWVIEILRMKNER